MDQKTWYRPFDNDVIRAKSKNSWLIVHILLISKLFTPFVPIHVICYLRKFVNNKQISVLFWVALLNANHSKGFEKFCFRTPTTALWPMECSVFHSVCKVWPFATMSYVTYPPLNLTLGTLWILEMGKAGKHTVAIELPSLRPVALKWHRRK